MNGIDDDNEDLSALDRGDEITDEITDEKGEKGEDENAEVEDAKGENTDADGGEGGEETPDDPPRDEKGRFKSKDDENLPIRLNKAKAQRDAERARADALEAQLRELQAKTNPEPEAPQTDPARTLDEEIASLYEQVEEARLDGDAKLAAQLQREIDAKNREITRLETSREVKQSAQHERDAQLYNGYLDILESKIEELSPDSELYDTRLVNEMEFQIRAYNHAGLSLSDALRRASVLLLGVDPAGAKPRTAQVTPNKLAEKPQPKKPDIERALDTARRQPPDMSSKGVNTKDQKIDVSRLSDTEFDALPESVKARYRGDEL